MNLLPPGALWCFPGSPSVNGVLTYEERQIAVVASNPFLVDFSNEKRTLSFQQSTSLSWRYNQSFLIVIHEGIENPGSQSRRKIGDDVTLNSVETKYIRPLSPACSMPGLSGYVSPVPRLSLKTLKGILCRIPPRSPTRGFA